MRCYVLDLPRQRGKTIVLDYADRCLYKLVVGARKFNVQATGMCFRMLCPGRRDAPEVPRIISERAASRLPFQAARWCICKYQNI